MADAEVRELARREDAASTVLLLWRPQDGEVFVLLADRVQKNTSITRVDPSRALDAYWHPYVYRDQPEPVQPARTPGPLEPVAR